MKKKNLKKRVEELELSTRSYAAASTGRRLESWKAGQSSANTEILQAGDILQNRSRQLRRDSPYAKKIISGIAYNAIGTGIIPASDDPDFLSLFNEWANSVECSSEKRMNLYSLQNLCVETLVGDGEFLIVKQYDSSRKVPLCLKVLESDFLDKTHNDIYSNLWRGIQLDDQGEPIGYWIHKTNPSEIYTPGEYFPASDVIHCFKPERPGQTRGVSWLTPVMIYLKKLSDFEDALLERQLISNLFTGFIYDTSGDVSSTTDPLSLEPGALVHLPSGKQIEFSNPPVAADPATFINHFLRAIATGGGYPYELLTGNLSEVNFSTARLSFNEFTRLVESTRWNLLIPQVLDRISQWFYEAITLTNLYAQEMPQVSWTPPRRVMFDIVRETPAITEQIKSGQISWSEAVREAGYDPKVLLKEISDDMKAFDKVGVKLSSDWRYAAPASNVLSQDQSSGQLEQKPQAKEKFGNIIKMTP